MKRRWIDVIGGDRLHEIYGSTESIATCTISGTEWLAHPGSVGRPVFGEVKVVNDKGAQVAAGEVGEIYMRRGADVPTPYRYIGADARVLADGWESVGDLGYLDEDGFVYLSDRRTDLILSGGTNIFPAEVEAVIGEHEGVAASAVIGLPDDELGQRVHAVVQPLPGVLLSVDALRAFVEARLVRYKVPRSFTLTADALVNEAGKMRRGAIRDALIRENATRP